MALTPDQAQVVYHFRIAGDPEDMLSTIGVDRGAAVAWTDADLSDLFDNYASTVLPHQSVHYTLVQVDVEVGEIGGKSTRSFVGSEDGGDSGDCLLQNAALLVHKITASVGRGKNGRMYLPGVPAHQANLIGQLDATYVANVNDSLSDWYTTFSTLSVPTAPAVNHGEASPLAPSQGVSLLVLDPLVATQRRRLRP